MLQAFLAGISGLRHHQLRLDVIGNNIANVNTVAFKSSRVTAQEGFARLLAGAHAGSDARGSTNPQQVGGGVRSGGVNTLFTQGGLEATGQPLDLAIQGNALFTIRDGDRTLYSRAGNFQIDATGRVILGGTDYVLQGVAGAADGQPTGALGDVILDLQQSSPATRTSRLDLAGNLDSSAEVGTRHVMTTTAYDSTGRPLDLTLTFTRGENGTWRWEAASDDASIAGAGTGVVDFNEDGTVKALTYDGGTEGLQLTPKSGGPAIQIRFNTSGPGAALRSVAGTTTAAVHGQDGRPSGELVNIQIGLDGTITGVFSNGARQAMARVALSRFQNPAGLERAGGNTFAATSASGEAVATWADQATGTVIYSGALEDSNVNVSAEFTDMIVAQRGFQASARVITTADELMDEVIRLRR